MKGKIDELKKELETHSENLSDRYGEGLMNGFSNELGAYVQHKDLTALDPCIALNRKNIVRNIEAGKGAGLHDQKGPQSVPT